jgi:protein ImuB
VDKPAPISATAAPLSRRHVRPPEEIFVTTRDHQPATFYFHGKKYVISHAYGPWLSAGDWWNQTLWGIEQWDIVAHSPEGALLCCCVIRDLMHNVWHMVALYD